MLTPMPGAVGPEAPELLLAELAGPTTAPGVDVADLAPVVPPQIGPATFTPDFFPEGPGGSGGVTPTGGFVSPPGGGPGGGGPGGPRQPPLTPPGPPPELPPSILPPDGPGVPGGHGGPGVVPEPATWAMLITGFFGVGTALRRRRARPA
ncbi:PEPxxWA-CTERM sorting domain-containing protein [Phenylobacterium sp.]|uniref:PEPxxWA-CTERM sorting domain-containing protein n=1 Tax=Phenylobacterium sp. TaxID=1871053 RepID=UPI002F3E1F23